MNFTRDPIIETIITPKDGFKLVIRNSKGSGQEEFFVDSVQIVLIGNNCFYRSLEKPKPFLVPASDYEVLEVREPRMVMKVPGHEKGGIKIAGGREAPMKAQPRDEEPTEEKAPEEEQPSRKEKKRFRRRRGDRFEKGEEQTEAPTDETAPDKPTFIIPPPPTLISETIARYKDMPGFASAFVEKKEEEEATPEEIAQEVSTPATEEPREDEEFFL